MDLDYPLILFCLTAATGALWLADVVLFSRARRTGGEAVLPDFASSTAAAPATPGDAAVLEQRRRMRERAIRRPGWIEMPAGLFPVLLAVFVLRSFLFEPFRIPSGSMMPTLEVGDFIVVNKFAYGLRLPIVDRELLAIGSPARGDVAVFRYPLDPSENYVKRVIGLPGDTVVYRDKRLTINGRPVAVGAAAEYFDSERVAYVDRAQELLPGDRGPIVHDVLFDSHRTDIASPIARFPFIDRCRYASTDASITCVVPEDHYFVMGDNRDNSADSRYWGFVPKQNLVGRAMFVWMNFSSPSRIGGFR